MSEKLNLNQDNESTNTQWSGLTELANKCPSSSKTLPLFTEVCFGYKISSAPFNNKSEAYDEIREYWQGADVTT